jgi:hypothetical protein
VSNSPRREKTSKSISVETARNVLKCRMRVNGYSYCFDRLIQKVEVRVTLRLAVSRQSVRLGDKPLETHDQRLFFFQLNTYVATSLTRGWDRLQLLLVLASAVILVSESRETHDHILLSQIRDSHNLEDEVPRIYIPQEQCGPVIPSRRQWVHRLLRLAGLRWRYSNPPSHEIQVWYSKVIESLYDWRFAVSSWRQAP